SALSVGNTRPRAAGTVTSLLLHAFRRLAREVLALEGAHEGDDALELLGAQLLRPGRHALVGDALRDDLVDREQRATVDEVRIGEVRADEALTARTMTGEAPRIVTGR